MSNYEVAMSNYEDREAIKELKALYARCADAVFNEPGTASALAMANLFTNDGTLELGPFGRHSGRQGLVRAFESGLPAATAWSIHYMMNPMLWLNDLEATGSWYFLIYYVSKTESQPGPGQLFGTYADKYKKVHGVWRIQESVASFLMPPKQ